MARPGAEVVLTNGLRCQELKACLSCLSCSQPEELLELQGLTVRQHGRSSRLDQAATECAATPVGVLAQLLLARVHPVANYVSGNAARARPKHAFSRP